MGIDHIYLAVFLLIFSFFAYCQQYNLYAPETQFDFPKDLELVTFDTPFGKFGMFTCFDIFSYDPAVVLVEKLQVDSVLFPTAWGNLLPILSAVPFHSSWARAMGVNLLAANVHNTTWHMTGNSHVTCMHQVAVTVLGSLHRLSSHTFP